MAYILTINVTEGIFLYRKTKLLMAVVLIGASFLMGKTLSVHVSGNQIKKEKVLLFWTRGMDIPIPAK